MRAAEGHGFGRGGLHACCCTALLYCAVAAGPSRISRLTVPCGGTAGRHPDGTDARGSPERTTPCNLHMATTKLQHGYRERPGISLEVRPCTGPIYY